TASFADRLFGRFAAKKVVGKNKKVLVDENELITPEIAKAIEEAGVEEVELRSPLTCKLSTGLCVRCYGWDFSTKQEVDFGVPVGVVAAQSIGEPGTQLTMRTRYVAGAVMQDVTHGLPRVEELFEMRTPKNLSPVAEISGKVDIETTDEGYKIVIKNAKVKPVEVQEYFVPLASELVVKDGQEIAAGSPLAAGYLDPKEIIKVKGIRSGQQYILTEAQKVYESQGIAINDKHFETIIRKMSDKVAVETVGDTPLIPGDFITQSRFEEVNAETLSQGGEPATARQAILGITKASLFSDSWLSAASFQETTKVLTEAALEGREDTLIGLKENVIIGRLIPVEGRAAIEARDAAAAPVEESATQELEERAIVEV
ncbi:MAG TPA: DNA-directed RNA polymerase subunit beta', partial [Candidatus Saccharimonadales bacterium]|nr:DNA-directed RNA polymerase subunit beta' [Candidatus Saccharimonadales bacterium]